MKIIYNVVIIALFFGFISCRKNEPQNIADNKVLEVIDDSYYKYEYDDDKYIVFSENHLFIKYVFNKKQSLNYIDYKDDEPIFTLDNPDLAFFKYIINDVLIFTYGTWANPLLVRFINLSDGNDLLDENYFFKSNYFQNGYILLKEIGHKYKLNEEQLLYLDHDIYKEALDLEIRRGGNEDRLMYYQEYSYDFVNKKLNQLNRIIAFSFE